MKKNVLSFFENVLGLSPFSNRFGCFCPALFFCPADSNDIRWRGSCYHHLNSNSSAEYT